MMNFFKTFFAAFLALVVFSFLSIVLLIGILSGLAAEEQVMVKDKSVLQLNLDAQISEQQVDNPLEGLPVPGGDVTNIGLLQLKETIKNAKNDPKIEGILLKVSFPMAGFATIEEIRQSILDFKKDGKWVVAYADMMSEQAYYLASAADKVYMNPEGDLEFNGLAIEISFFKKMFEKLEVKPQVFRVGEFKSAVEPFVLEKMSDENRLQLTELVNAIYDHVLTGISASRNIPADRLAEISDKMLIRSAKQSVEYKLIDSLLYQDQLLDELRGRLSMGKSSKVNFISYKNYRKAASSSYSSSKNEIAVIVADGTIMPGRADEGVIGSSTFVDEIRKARESDRVKAIVIRVNSPGGSFQASDMMWREISLAAESKPVIASMSDYAASGGYYLSMGCDTIIAQPHTITGSIGVFSIWYDASGLLGNKLGITSDEVKTGEFGEMFTISRPLTDAEKNVWQRKTDAIYETFTKKAAAGRGTTQETIKKVASGRVWTGSQALERGLVDMLGGYDDAVRLAAEKAGVADDYRVKLYPRQRTFFQQLMEDIEDNTRVSMLEKELGENYRYYQYWNSIKNYQGLQARMPFDFKIH